ncbi:hypothetical protein CRM22_005499 [Opisthorchis felineus]|uniref:Uncharacterized protein n=1 Tax=Opisthorchis felineus TaxID=147828 RepID=A0A4S2LQW3_OPIFE|nr:hypothetical protein CRM22_005499 [Opisthorchis felineus]
MTTELKSLSIYGFTDSLRGLLSPSNVKQTGTPIRTQAIRKTSAQSTSRSFTDVLLQRGSVENRYSDENKPVLDIPSCASFTSKSDLNGPLLMNGIDNSIVDQTLPSIQSEMLPVEYETLDIHETYQLGFCDFIDDAENSSRLYIFDFVDGLEVSYPVSIPTSTDPPLDLPPLFLEPDYVDQLAVLASNAFSELTQLLNEWLLCCQRTDEQRFVWQHVVAHQEAVELRRRTLELLNTLIPHSVPLSAFDVHSPRVDQFFARLLSALTTTANSIDDDLAAKRDKLHPVVSLCPDPHHCLAVLRSQIVLLLRTLLPQMILPQSFDTGRDLSPLLSLMCELNRTG